MKTSDDEGHFILHPSAFILDLSSFRLHPSFFTLWRRCGRHYELVEFDTTESASREVRRNHVLDVSADGVKWIDPFDSIGSSG